MAGTWYAKDDNMTTTTCPNDTSSLTYPAGTWSSASGSNYYNSTIHYSTSAAGSTFLFQFTGTGFRYYALKNPSYGIVAVYIDDVLQGDSIDLYASTALYKSLVYEKTGLTNGQHSVRIQSTGNKNPSSTSARINLDYVEWFDPSQTVTITALDFTSAAVAPTPSVKTVTAAVLIGLMALAPSVHAATVLPASAAVTTIESAPVSIYTGSVLLTPTPVDSLTTAVDPAIMAGPVIRAPAPCNQAITLTAPLIHAGTGSANPNAIDVGIEFVNPQVHFHRFVTASPGIVTIAPVAPSVQTQVAIVADCASSALETIDAQVKGQGAQIPQCPTITVKTIQPVICAGPVSKTVEVATVTSATNDPAIVATVTVTPGPSLTAVSMVDGTVVPGAVKWPCSSSSGVLDALSPSRAAHVTLTPELVTPLLIEALTPDTYANIQLHALPAIMSITPIDATAHFASIPATAIITVIAITPAVDTLKEGGQSAIVTVYMANAVTVCVRHNEAASNLTVYKAQAATLKLGR